MKSPTFKQLRYYLALVECEHFGKAAEKSFVSQSAFSTAIQELETILGIQLVDRTNRNVTITALGHEVAVQARLVLRDLAGLVDIAGRQRGVLTGKLRLGVIPTIAPFLLPPVLPLLREAKPDLKVFLTEDTTNKLHQRLLAGELDVVLLALPWPLRNVETLTLFEDRFKLACRVDTQLVDPHNYRFSRLNANSVLLLEEGHCLREHALAACRVRNIETVSRFSASSLLTLVEMVDADLGVTFLPEMAEESALLRDTRVRLFDLKDSGSREIGLAWRRGSGREKEFRMLGQFLVDSFRGINKASRGSEQTNCRQTDQT